MKKAAALLTSALLCWSSPVGASDWETSARTAFFSTLTVDAAQTTQVRRTPGVHETNVLLGKKPGELKTLAYFGVCAFGGDQLIQNLFDSSWKRAAAYSAIGAFELGLILFNNPKTGMSKDVRFFIPLVKIDF